MLHTLPWEAFGNELEKKWSLEKLLSILREQFDNFKEIPPVNDSIFHCRSTKNIQNFKICRLFLFCYFSWKDTSLGCNVMKDPLEKMLAVGN